MLVVDDDPACREALMEFLVREGHRVRMAADGLEAYELLRRGRIDCSVMDVHMPGLTGPEVLWRVLEELGTPGVPPTVLTSSDAAAEVFARALHGMAVDFVAKPIRLDALRRSIENLLNPPRHLTGG
jgi:CheY-like chemotaxis protein